ncbi:zinc finger domain-containing protein [Haloactinopolyspora alba]
MTGPDPTNGGVPMLSPIPDNVRDVVCPRCHAPVGSPCDWAPFRSWMPHPERIDHANDADQSGSSPDGRRQ